MAIACALFAASTVAALFVILAHPLSPFSPGLGILLSLAWIYGAAALPFFFAGCVITLAISAWTRQINRLYLFDLAGAALGCLLLVPALGTLGAIDTVLLVALLASARRMAAVGPALHAGSRGCRGRCSSPGTASRPSWSCARPRASRKRRSSSRAGTPSRA